MTLLLRFYRWIQWLSLDVVIGAVASGAMVARWLEVAMPMSWWVALPMSVWVLYTADHLLDAYRLGDRATTDRHRFHTKYFYPLAFAWVVSFLFCAGVLPFWVPMSLVWLGVGVGLLAMAHLGLVWWIRDRIAPWHAKELGVAIVYTTGVWGGPLVIAQPEWSPWILLPLVQFACLALINLLIFAWYEQEIDGKDGATSWVRGLGPERSRLFMKCLIIGNVLLSGIAIWGHSKPLDIALQATLMPMLLLLAWILFDQTRFGPHDRYRLFADAAFILPIWALL